MRNRYNELDFRHVFGPRSRGKEADFQVDNENQISKSTIFCKSSCQTVGVDCVFDPSLCSLSFVRLGSFELGLNKSTVGRKEATVGRRAQWCHELDHVSNLVQDGFQGDADPPERALVRAWMELPGSHLWFIPDSLSCENAIFPRWVFPKRSVECERYSVMNYSTQYSFGVRRSPPMVVSLK